MKVAAAWSPLPSRRPCQMKAIPLMPLVAVVLLALILSGCLGGDEPDATPSTPGPALPGGAQVTFAHRTGGVMAENVTRTPYLLTNEVGMPAWEPTMGIDDDGTMFYQAFDALRFPREPPTPYVLRSSDDGATWEDVSPATAGLNRHVTSLDPFLHLDRDTGRVFTMDWWATGGCHQLSFSDDHGDSWTTTEVCGPMDGQRLWTGPPTVSDPLGYPNIVYVCSLHAGAGAPYNMATQCWKSLDGGLTLVATGEPAFLANPFTESDGPVKGRCFGGTQKGATAPDGTLYLVAGWCDEIFIAISHDEGATWDRVQVSHTGIPVHRVPPPLVPPAMPLPNEDFPVASTISRVAVDQDGTVYVTWVGADRLPYLAHSTDGGYTWSDAVMFGHPNVTETHHPWIEVHAPGQVAVNYMGSEDSKFPQDGLEADYEDTTWTGYVTVTSEALEEDPLFFTARVRSLDEPLVRGVCRPSQCTGAGDFFGLAIAPDGTPWAAFVDVAGTEGNYGWGLASRMLDPWNGTEGRA